MSIGSILFGTKPKAETQELGTLGPEQMRVIQEVILPFFLGNKPEDAGAAVPGLSNLQGASLSALEQLAEQLAVGSANPTTSAAQGAVTDILNRGGDRFDEFFNSNVRDPAIRDFNENVLPAISREFASSFFGSDRERADRFATRDLLDSLTRARADLSVRNDQTRLDAARQAPGLDNVEFQQLIQSLQAGEIPRNVDLQRLAAQDQRLAQLLNFLGLQTKENVVLNKPGSSGLAGDLIQGGAKIIAGA